MDLDSLSVVKAFFEGVTEMLQLIRKLAWQDENIKGSLGALGFGTAKTDRDYLNWHITNKELYETCRQEAQYVKNAFESYEKETKQAQKQLH